MSLHLSKCHIVGNHMSRLIYSMKFKLSLFHFANSSSFICLTGNKRKGKSTSDESDYTSPPGIN